MLEDIEMHLIYRGRVQGVGFRATARHYAKQIGLVGHVRNLPDGSVEANVVGTRQKINEFMRALEEEFSAEVVSREISPPRSYDSFNII